MSTLLLTLFCRGSAGGLRSRAGGMAIGLLTWSAFIGAAPLVCASPAAAATLTTWQYDPTRNQLEITLADGATMQPKHFLMAQPARIVLDLPNTALGDVPNQTTYPGAAVRRVSVSQFQAGVTRFVLELNPDVELAPTQVKLERGANRLVLRPLLATDVLATDKATNGATTRVAATVSPPPEAPGVSIPVPLPDAESLLPPPPSRTPGNPTVQVPDLPPAPGKVVPTNATPTDVAPIKVAPINATLSPVVAPKTAPSPAPVPPIAIAPRPVAQGSDISPVTVEPPPEAIEKPGQPAPTAIAPLAQLPPEATTPLPPDTDLPSTVLPSPAVGMPNALQISVPPPVNMPATPTVTIPIGKPGSAAIGPATVTPPTVKSPTLPSGTAHSPTLPSATVTPPGGSPTVTVPLPVMPPQPQLPAASVTPPNPPPPAAPVVVPSFEIPSTVRSQPPDNAPQIVVPALVMPPSPVSPSPTASVIPPVSTPPVNVPPVSLPPASVIPLNPIPAPVTISVPLPLANSTPFPPSAGLPNDLATPVTVQTSQGAIATGSVSLTPHPSAEPPKVKTPPPQSWALQSSSQSAVPSLSGSVMLPTAPLPPASVVPPYGMDRSAIAAGTAPPIAPAPATRPAPVSPNSWVMQTSVMPPPVLTQPLQPPMSSAIQGVPSAAMPSSPDTSTQLASGVPASSAPIGTNEVMPLATATPTVGLPTVGLPPISPPSVMVPPLDAGMGTGQTMLPSAAVTPIAPSSSVIQPSAIQPGLAKPQAIAQPTVVDFGQPLPTGGATALHTMPQSVPISPMGTPMSPTGSGVMTTGTGATVQPYGGVVQSPNPAIALAMGTTLNLRYSGATTLPLDTATGQQGMMVLQTEVRNAAGAVVFPVGSYVMGQFEATPGGTRFVATSIQQGDRIVPFFAASEALNGNREISPSSMALFSGAGALAGGLVSQFSGWGLLLGGAAGAATNYLTTPKPPTALQPGQIVQVKMLRDVPY